MSEDKQTYLRRRAIEEQKSIVNVKSAATSTVESCIWTYRTTSCDVISLITTTVPIKNGAMNDLRYVNKEMKRIKAPIAKPGTFLATHPLLNKLNDAEETLRKRKNDTLKLEKKAFMSKLMASRFIRGTIENLAVTFIQKSYRGHLTRLHMHEIALACGRRKIIRQRIRAYLRDHLGLGDALVLTYGEHRFHYKTRLYRAALVIQCAYRMFISRKTLAVQRRVIGMRRRLAAILRMQRYIRKIIACSRVAKKRVAITNVYKSNSVCKIQQMVRKFIACRRVHRRRVHLRWVAARMIQCWFRVHRARAYVAIVRHRLTFVRTFNGALAMQKIVRKRIAWHRVQVRSSTLPLYHISSLYHIYPLSITIYVLLLYEPISPWSQHRLCLLEGSVQGCSILLPRCRPWSGGF